MPAHDNFVHGLAEVDALCASARSSDGNGSPQDTIFTNVVNRAAVLLLVAHFEGYLIAMAEEYVDGLTLARVPMHTVPPKLRELHTDHLVRNILAAADTKEKWNAYARLDSVSALWSNQGVVGRGILQAERLSQCIGDGSAATIDDLFSYMGCSDPVCNGELDILRGQQDATVNIRWFLRDLMKCRDDIAHGKESRIPTAEDVVRYRDFLAAMAERLDRKFQEILKRIE